MVHGLVHQHGGHLQVLNSKYGVQFRFWLPVAEKSEAELEFEAESEEQEFLPDLACHHTHGECFKSRVHQVAGHHHKRIK